MNAERLPDNVERIVWRSVVDGLPDDEQTVLMFGEKIGEAWPGYYEANRWHLCDGVPFENNSDVTHWAHMPVGPTGEKL